MNDINEDDERVRQVMTVAFKLLRHELPEGERVFMLAVARTDTPNHLHVVTNLEANDSRASFAQHVLRGFTDGDAQRTREIET